MKKFVFGLMLLLAACQQEIEPLDGSSGTTTTSSGSIIGTWKLVDIHAQTVFTEESSNIKTVTNSAYNTNNNTGTLTFNDTDAVSTDLSYSIDTSAITYTYTGGILTDSATIPLLVTIPPTSGSAPYKLIGTDSISFPQGSFVSVAGSSGSSQSPPSGATYTITGNKLVIMQSGSSDTTQVVSGDLTHITQAANLVATYQKQ